jgi:hypothetical protein
VGLLTPNEFLLAFADPRTLDDPDHDEFKLITDLTKEPEEPLLLRSESLVSDVIAPREMPEIHEVIEEVKQAAQVEDSVFAKVRVRVTRVRSFQKIWSTQGTPSRHPCTIFAPKVGASWGKQTICIGHYAVNAIVNSPSAACYTLEFVGSTAQFNVVKDRLLPHPTKYTQVWRKELTTGSVFVWKPVSPSDNFVALGMVCTTDAKEPPVTMTYCIPSGWLVPSRASLGKLWDDSGTGGKRGSFWKADQFNLLVAVPSLDRPTGPFYDMWKQEFYASDRVSEVKWDHDEHATNCYLCSKAFSMLTRKHHCRICGHIFCKSCSKYQVKLSTADGTRTKSVRACEVCKDSPALPDLPG